MKEKKLLDKWENDQLHKQLIKNIQEKADQVAIEITEALKNLSQIEDGDLKLWLRYTNAINMHRVCYAYYRGSLYYDNDPYHFASFIHNLKAQYVSSTTLSSLELILQHFCRH